MTEDQRFEGRLGRFSQYVVYADESGDHSLVKVDATYPVFVLCLCIFHKQVYTKRIVPRVQEFKFNWFGHDSIVLHERDIRKQLPPFDRYRSKLLKFMFMEEITQIMKSSPFRIAASVIGKNRLSSDFFSNQNPYEIALESCLISTHSYFVGKVDENEIVHFVFEMRGRKEDAELELAFRRIIGGENSRKLKLPHYEIVFVDKKANSSGMQLADLTARPIGIHAIRPWQTNRAYEIIKRKLIRIGSSRKTAQNIVMFP